MAKYVKKGRNAPHLGVADTTLVKALAAFASRAGLSLSDPSALEEFASSLGVSVAAAVANPIVTYGVHTETMFEWVADAMGQCTLLQALDNGSRSTLDDKEVASPDFLIVTQEGRRLVVEVKNCASRSHPPRRDFKRPYLQRLQRYAAALDAEAKVAIFWTMAGLWSLVDVDFLLSSDDGSKIAVTLFDALAESEMAILGDRWVHLNEYPFRFRLDFRILERRSTTGQRESLNLVITDVGMTLGGKAVPSGTDSRVLLYLAMFGMDTSGGEDFVFDSDDAAHVEFTAGVDFETQENGLLSAGPLSTMLTRQYRAMSCDDSGQISGLGCAKVPEHHVGRLLSSGYQGDDLGLVYFVLAPRHAAEDA